MRQRTKKDECNKRLWHVFVLLNIRLWNYYSLMCSNCGCCYVTTTDHYHSKRHTLKNTHSIIEKPCETQTDNPSHVLGCFNVSRKKKKDRMEKKLHSARVRSARFTAASPSRCTGVYLLDSGPGRVMSLLVFSGGGRGGADRMSTSWVLPLETLQTSRKQKHTLM